MQKNTTLLIKLSAISLLILLGVKKSAFAQSSNIVPDETLSSENSLVQRNFFGLPIELIRGGAIRGYNLFHSFKEFNVSENRSAYFLSPSADIQNILTRVTGRNRSEIFGTLGTLQSDFSPSNANFFLINPNGIIFGKNARLDVGGSFVGTTANAVEFTKGEYFSASNPQVPQLLTINPSAFLFNQILPAAIINQSRVANDIEPSFTEGLLVSSRTLLLLGGNITLDGGVLRTLGGRIELGGLAGTGSVGLNIDGNNLDLNFPANIPKADISLTNEALVSASGLGGGEIQLSGNNVTLSRNSNITSITLGNQNGKTISIQASQLNLSDLSTIITLTNAEGNSGDILIDTENLSMQNLTNIGSTTIVGQGNAGNITVRATNNINLDNSSTLSTLSLGVGNVTDKSGGGNVFIDAKTLNLQNTSAILVSSFLGKGNPGNLTLQVADSINLSNSRISTASFSSASGGDIAIETGNLHLRNGSQINNSNLDPTTIDFNTVGNSLNTLSPEFQQLIALIIPGLISTLEPGNANNFGQANSGNLNIRAANSIVLSGISPDGIVNTISTETQGGGKAGNLNLETGQLVVGDSSAISTQTTNRGDGGNLIIKADSVELTNKAQIIAQSEGTGKAGNINLNVTGKLNATNSNILTSSTQSSGGIINIAAQDIRLFSNSDIRTNVFNGAGGGGNITLTANSIIALNDSDILSFARDGKGGDIRFNTRAFLSSPLYRSTFPTTDAAILDTLDGNKRVDVNASGAIAGNITGVPDISFLQNSLTELPQNVIDTNALLANSCIARRNNQQSGTFFVTGSGGLPVRPGDASLSPYSTGNIQSVASESKSPTSTVPRRRWKIGDRIVEPQGVYQLATGERILSRECSD